MTYTELVQKVAAEHGETPPVDECDFVLWEMTAFPYDDAAGTEASIRKFYAAPDRQAHINSIYDEMSGGACAPVDPLFV